MDQSFIWEFLMKSLDILWELHLDLHLKDLEFNILLFDGTIGKLKNNRLLMKLFIMDQSFIWEFLMKSLDILWELHLDLIHNLKVNLIAITVGSGITFLSFAMFSYKDCFFFVFALFFSIVSF